MSSPTTTPFEVPTTDGDTVVLEGTIVSPDEGPQGDTTPPAEGEAPAASDTPAGEENPSTAVATVDKTVEVETSELSKAEARSLTNKIKKGLEGAAALTERMNKSVHDTGSLLAEAYAKRAWVALELPSWEDYVTSEMGDLRVRLDRAVRQSLVYQMATEAKMTTRAIAPVIGYDQKTVSNDLRQVKRELGIESAPSKVKGLDGKEYEVTPASPRKPRKKAPVLDRFSETAQQVYELLDNLAKMTQEEEFEAMGGQVAKAHRSDFAKWIDTIKGLQKAIGQ